MRKSVAGTGSDPTIQYHELELDGNKYKLVFGFNELAEAEAITGLNLLQGMAAFMNNLATVTHYRGLLFAALHKLQPNITIEDAGELLSITEIFEVKKAIIDAYNISKPEKKRLVIEIASEPEIEA